MSGHPDTFFWKALADHAELCVQAAQLLREMLDHLDSAADYAGRLKGLEHEGDKITHGVVKALHATWITPLENYELRGFISGLDDVMDVMDDTAERLSLFDIREATPEARELTDIMVEGVRKLRDVIGLLPSIKNKPTSLIALCHEIDQSEARRRGL